MKQREKTTSEVGLPAEPLGGVPGGGSTVQPSLSRGSRPRPTGQCACPGRGGARGAGEHSLKRRSAKTTRPVPIPPVLVRMPIEHIARFGVTADGRIFQNAAGNYLDTAAYRITWRRAREVTLTA